MKNRKQIWKYPIKITSLQNVSMPQGATILTVQMQGTKPFLWAEIDPQAPVEEREIEVIPTGNPMQDWPRKYIGTIQTDGGEFVWHVFESLE